jgi:hypothetical protein
MTTIYSGVQTFRIAIQASVGLMSTDQKLSADIELLFMDQLDGCPEIQIAIQAMASIH